MPIDYDVIVIGGGQTESRGAHILQDVKEEKEQWEGNLIFHRKTIKFGQGTVSKRT